MATKQLRIRVEASVLDDFADVCDADHMDAQMVAKMLIVRFASVKRGHLLQALASIPDQYFRRPKSL